MFQNFDDMQKFAKDNSGYRYALVCIDVLSRMLYVEPVRQKTAPQMIDALQNVFARAGVRPWRVYSDAGKEFTAKEVRAYFAAQDIGKKEAATHDVLHATMAERAIRTLRERLAKYFSEHSTFQTTSACVVNTSISAAASSISEINA